MQYVVLLRAVNVGGNPLRMERLREMCAGLGLKNVRTYLQSGNVVADARSDQWAGELEEKLTKVTRLAGCVIVRPAEAWARVAAENPFLAEPGMVTGRLYVTFLAGKPTREGLAKLGQVQAGTGRCKVVGTEVFLHCPDGYGSTKLSNLAVEKALGLRATTRNWNTVMNLLEMVRKAE